MKYISDIIQFRVTPKVDAFIIKKSVIVLGSGLLIYLFILVNYLLLQKELSIQLNVLFISLIIFFISSIIIFYYVKYSQLRYDFYETYLSVMDKKIFYESINNFELKTNNVDNFLKVGEIVLFLDNNKKFKISNIEKYNTIYFFLQKKIIPKNKKI